MWATALRFHVVGRVPGSIRADWLVPDVALIAENSPDAMFEATADSIIEWFSPAVREVLSWEPDELVGRSPVELVHEDDLRTLRAAALEVAAGHRVDTEMRLRTPRGNYRCIGVTMRPVLDRQGRVTRRVGAWRDVTARTLDHRRLLDEQSRFRVTIDGVLDPLVHLHDVRGGGGSVVDFT